MKITFTAEAAEIAEQEPANLGVLGVLGGSFSDQITESGHFKRMNRLGVLGGLGG